MPLVCLNETGDHSMGNIDPSYPVFGLVMTIVDADEYTEKIIPAFCKMKIELFGHEGVVLQSYEIRKKRNTFALLKDAELFTGFMSAMNTLMAMDYALIGAFIRKEHHKNKYGDTADNPYHLSLMYAMERLVELLGSRGQTQVQIVAESRGKNEDDDLRKVFYQFASMGSYYVSAQTVKKIDFRLSFCDKATNLIGMQIADLAAYPIARHVIDPNKANPNFDLIKPKFYCNRIGTMKGLKIFP